MGILWCTGLPPFSIKKELSGFQNRKCWGSTASETTRETLSETNFFSYENTRSPSMLDVRSSFSARVDVGGRNLRYPMIPAVFYYTLNPHLSLGTAKPVPCSRRLNMAKWGSGSLGVTFPFLLSGTIGIPIFFLAFTFTVQWFGIFHYRFMTSSSNHNLWPFICSWIFSCVDILCLKMKY